MFRLGGDCVGLFCISKCGHDAGECYIIVSAAGNFVNVANGKNRTIKNPKRKNPNHLFITRARAEDFEKLTDLRLAELIKKQKRSVNE